jgi:hypothetical protein
VMRADAPELASGPPRLAACVQLLHHRRLAPESYRTIDSEEPHAPSGARRDASGGRTDLAARQALAVAS